MRARRSGAGAPSIAVLLVVSILGPGCGGDDAVPPAAEVTPTAAPAPEPPRAEPSVAAEPAADPLLVERPELNLKFRIPASGWERKAASETFPEAAVLLDEKDRPVSFALVGLRLEGGEVEDLPMLRSRAASYFESRTQLVDVEETRTTRVASLDAGLTIGQGVVDGALVRLAGAQVLTEDTAYHLIAWGPLLEVEARDLTRALDRLGAGFDLLEWTPAVAVLGAEVATASRGLARGLDFDVVDAAYSEALDRLVLVSEVPPALHVVDPLSAETVTVPLERVPLRVAVESGGHKAVAGHSGRLSLVDLRSRRLTTTRRISIEPFSLVLSSRGWAYISPTGSGFDGLFGAKIPGSVELPGRGSRSVYASSTVQLHPDGKRLYLASRGVSPDHLMRFDVSEGRPEAGIKWSYHGDYSSCGDLWISRDGRRIYTACGNVFRASMVRENDMLYDGKLHDAPFVYDLAESPDGRHLVLLRADKRPGSRRRGDQGGSDEVRVYFGDSLTPSRTDPLPPLEVGGESLPVLARHLFVTADGGSYVAVVEASAARGQPRRFGIVVGRL